MIRRIEGGGDPSPAVLVVGQVRAPSQLLIGGAWTPSTSGRSLAVHDPSTGGLLATVADAGTHDAVAALDAAASAQPAWAATPRRERSEVLRRAYEAVVAHADDLATLISLEMGKPLAEARAEVAYGAEFLRWFSQEAERVAGHAGPAPDGRGRSLVSRQPVGPAYLVTPWNFPLAMPTRKLGAALAAGCTCIVKPAELTPLTTLALAGLLGEAGVPAGVVNVVTTSDPGAVTDALVADPRLRKLSFTGSTTVGRHLVSASSAQLLRLSLELGGNAPFLVFADADVPAAVQGAVAAKMRNAGQACTAANRFLVHEGVADRFTELLAARLGAMTVGRGLEEGTEVGPLISAAAVARVAGLVDASVAGGAEVVVGGTALAGPGSFYAPTVLTSVPADAAVMREEVFGPVAPVTTFRDDDEALALANGTSYGLAAYAYTRDLDRALRVVDALEVGMVGVNQGTVSSAAAPFGGIKHSGYGREGGAEGIHEYLQVKYAAVAS